MTYKIKTRKDFKDFLCEVNNGNVMNTVNAELLNNIDLNPGVDLENGKGADSFQKIGQHSRNPFYGVFEGNGFTISGLYANGLFGYNRGIIRNLTIDGHVYSHGALVTSNYGQIINCVNRATVAPLSDLPSGIAHYNHDKSGKITGCRNEGDLIINRFRFFPTVLKPSQICGYKAQKICGTTYDRGEMREPDNLNTEAGNFILTNGNTVIGLALQTAVFSDSNGILPEVKEILLKDPNINYLNASGQSYLHLLCENPLYISNKTFKRYLTDLIIFLAEHSSIDFGLKDINGFEAGYRLKYKSGRIVPGFASVVKLLASIKNEQAQERKIDEMDYTFSDIGF